MAPDPMTATIGTLPQDLVTDEVASRLGGRDLAEAAVFEAALLGLTEALKPRLFGRERVVEADLADIEPFLTGPALKALQEALKASQNGAKGPLEGLVAFGIADGSWRVPKAATNPLTGVGIDRQSTKLEVGAAGRPMVTIRYLLTVTGVDPEGTPEVRTVVLDRVFELAPTGGSIISGRPAQWRIDSWSGQQSILPA